MSKNASIRTLEIERAVIKDNLDTLESALQDQKVKRKTESEICIYIEDAIKFKEKLTENQLAIRRILQDENKIGKHCSEYQSLLKRATALQSQFKDILQVYKSASTSDTKSPAQWNKNKTSKLSKFTNFVTASYVSSTASDNMGPSVRPCENPPKQSMQYENGVKDVNKSSTKMQSYFPQEPRDFGRYSFVELPNEISGPTRFTPPAGGDKKEENIQTLNILLLGETGVGKSTWINGFANYMKFSSLDSAENGNPMHPIPTQFTVCDKKFREVRIVTGTGANEVFESGQSATQESRVYLFKLGDKQVKLIDTPGIGDTRGNEQDFKNFRNILSTLAHFEEIHGICILLKPNTARLNVMFRFCVKELLTYLHQEASKNIIFCFTNSRSTFYKPGDTLPALTELLRETKDVVIPLKNDNVFCFDTEAYRFLAAIKNSPPLEFQKEERNYFAESWQKSTQETQRLIQYVSQLPPHRTDATICLNNARYSIIRLARPLAEIHRLIQTNKTILNEEIESIGKCRHGIKDLESKKFTTVMEIETIRLNKPRTVCTSKLCINCRIDGNRFFIEYKTVCHAECTLDGVDVDTVGDEHLKHCVAFQNQGYSCTKCGHSYLEHLHMYYESKQVIKKQEDRAVIRALQKNLTMEETKKEIIDSKFDIIHEYEKEMNVLTYSSAMFSYFLKSQSIFAQEDALEQHLYQIIKEERTKIASGGSEEGYESLLNIKKAFLKHRDNFEIASRSDTAVPKQVQPEEIENQLQVIKQLKFSGPIITKALECVNYTRNTTFNQSIVWVDVGHQSGHLQTPSNLPQSGTLV